MATFDQRGQRVTYQYNAGGGINFTSAQNQPDLVAQLEKLRDEVTKATAVGDIDEAVAIDAEYQITKAVQQARTPAPDKKSILDYLGDAKEPPQNKLGKSG